MFDVYSFHRLDRGEVAAARGFTSIELLVAMAIGLLLIGLGIAGYVNFNERQKVLNSARELETVFQTAQVKAQAGDLAGCDQLSEYRISFNTAVNPVVITLTPVCAVPTTGATEGEIKTYLLGSGVGLSLTPAASAIHFPVLRRSVNFTPAAAGVSFGLTSSAVTQTYSFTLSQGGDSSDGNWQ